MEQATAMIVQHSLIIQVLKSMRTADQRTVWIETESTFESEQGAFATCYIDDVVRAMLSPRSRNGPLRQQGADKLPEMHARWPSPQVLGK
jgi:hypothetical protein